jgi:hypothetical protein
MLKLLNNKKGFTIIEATLAIIILMVGFFAVMEFFPFAMKIIGDSQSLAIASNLTLSKVEEISSTPYDNISIGMIEAKHKISNDSESYLNNYERETYAEYLDSNLNPSLTDNGLKRVTVITYWKSPIISNEKSTQIDIIIADY